MTCCKCQNDWCWICGQSIAGGSIGIFNHYDPANPASVCLQFSSADSHPDPVQLRALRQRQGVMRKRLMWVTIGVRALATTLMILSILAMTISLGLAELCLAIFASWICCLPCYCRAKLTKHDVKDWIATCAAINVVLGVLLGLLILSALWIAWSPIALLLSLVYAMCQKNPLMRRFVMQELLGAPWAPMRSQFAPLNFHHRPAPHPVRPQLAPPNDGAIADDVVVQSDDEERSDGLNGLAELPELP